MKYLTILLLSVFILSCTTAPQISEDAFISSRPDLKVQFHKPIVKKFESSRRLLNGDVKRYEFLVNKWEGIRIEIFTYIPSRSGIEFYGPVQFLTNAGRLALDPVVIDGRQWIKFVHSSGSEFLFIGYFIIMDNYWISVGRISRNDAYTKIIQSKKKRFAIN